MTTNFNIIACDGGGIRGLITAVLLNDLVSNPPPGSSSKILNDLGVMPYSPEFYDQVTRMITVADPAFSGATCCGPSSRTPRTRAEVAAGRRVAVVNERFAAEFGAPAGGPRPATAWQRQKAAGN